jgi:CheY-like chemotaxis protein
VPHTLLLADDSITIQRVIELTFADEDIRVVAVSDGKQAVQRAQAEAPDIVLADVGMPEMDGYEVAAFIKRTPGLSHVPVLLLTGAFEPVDEQRARAAGCDGVLVKPFEPQMVISRVKDLIAGRPAATAVPRAAGEALQVSPSAPVFAAPPPATDEYFDRLDAALSSFDSTAPTIAMPVPVPPVGVGSGPAGSADMPTVAMPMAPPQAPVPGSPTIEPAATAGSAERGAEPVAAASPAQAPVPVATAAAAPTSAPASSPSLLAEAFEALLAAEQGRPLDSAAAQRAGSSDTLIDHITRQVIARLADDRMRDVVIEVAERLVREEIARIKSAAN